MLMLKINQKSKSLSLSLSLTAFNIPSTFCCHDKKSKSRQFILIIFDYI